MIDGYSLTLEDYCAYCPEFEPDDIKLDCTQLGESKRIIHTIKCEHETRCARMAENIKQGSSTT